MFGIQALKATWQSWAESAASSVALPGGGSARASTFGLTCSPVFETLYYSISQCECLCQAGVFLLESTNPVLQDLQLCLLPFPASQYRLLIPEHTPEGRSGNLTSVSCHVHLANHNNVTYISVQYLDNAAVALFLARRRCFFFSAGSRMVSNSIWSAFLLPFCCSVRTELAAARSKGLLEVPPNALEGLELME